MDRDFAGQYEIPDAAVRVTVGGARLGNSLSTDDPVTLRTPAGELLAAYSHPFDPGNGRSVEMADLAVGDVAENWAAAPTLIRRLSERTLYDRRLATPAGRQRRRWGPGELARCRPESRGAEGPDRSSAS